MAGLDNTGFRILNPFCFALGIFAPEQIDNRSIKSINPLNPIIRKGLPSKPGMAVWLSFRDRQRSIEKQYTLFCPVIQASVLRNRISVFIEQFLIDINQGFWQSRIRIHRESKSVCLSWIIVRILSDDARLFGNE